MGAYHLLFAATLLFGYALAGRIRNGKREAYTFQFTASVYNVSIEENTRGKDVYAISNEAIRMGVPLPNEGAIVKFKIVEGDKQYFKAESKTVGNFAFLRIRHRSDDIINRELKERYEFLIKAFCRRKDATNLETTAVVNLLVTDQNDARPIFEQVEYRAQVKQDIMPFSTILQVQASDADIALNSQIYYSLLEPSNDFMIDPISGAIRNLRPLKSGIYELTLLAEDRASRLFHMKTQTDLENDHFNRNRAKTVIIVDSVKKNESKLDIEVKPILATLWNVTQIVALVKLKKAASKDKWFSVDIIDGEHSNGFIVKKDTERKDVWFIETIAGIPLESNCSLQLKAVVADDISNNLFSNISIEVIGRRIVQFEEVPAVHELIVNESVPLGYAITQLKAHVINGFFGDDEQIRYSISLSNKSLPFRIDEKSGYLRVMQWLDYENTSFYQFEVVAKVPKYDLKASKKVEIKIADSNDNYPIFAAKWARGDAIALPRNFALNESLLKAEALDIDSGANGQIRYELFGDGITANSAFAINSQSGQVFLQQRPPEKESHWKLKIKASDNGWPFPRSSEVIINVYLKDTKVPSKTRPSLIREPQNEQAPVFTEQMLLTVSADASPGKVIGKINAHDADIGYAGLVRFGTMDKFFGLKPFTGELFVLISLVDLMKIKNQTKLIEYKVNVTACDWGQPVKCTNGSVKVLISEANLHAPRFEKSHYRVHIAENTEIGTKILALSAQDSDNGDNGRIGYRIVDIHSYFAIDELKGILEVKSKLDREEKQFHRFTVMAFDHGLPMQVAFANITIIISDVNDNAPLCAQSVQKVIIPEDYPNNALLTCAVAWDTDEGRNAEIVYTFDSTVDSSSAALPFRIQEDTGCIFTNISEPFDFETVQSYSLSVEVMDNGEPMLSSICKVIVELSDVNENLFPPMFDDIAQETTIHENMPIWTEVLALHAVDPDDSSAPVKYSIIDGDGIASFTIDSEGLLRTTVVLDREVSDFYWLTIEASDLNPTPLTSVFHVYVQVLNRNDHAPLPSRPIYFASVPENSPEDTVLIKVEAEDKDNLPNRYGIRSMRFKIISGDPQSFFTIDAKTGYVITRGKRRLDRETQKEHTVTIEICDQGDPELCTTVPIVITITDINDNAPFFKQESYNFNVPADQSGELCRIFAIDFDEGENAQLFYNFTEVKSAFSIDSDGSIAALESLKENEVYELIVKASDMGKPQRTSSPVLITLNAIGRQKETNGKPKLLNANAWNRLSISDADSIGETIGLIEAEDPNGDQLWWKIISGNPNNLFAIRCDAGELYLAKSIDSINNNISEVILGFSVSDGFDSTEGEDIEDDLNLMRSITMFSSGQVVVAEPLDSVITNSFTIIAYARFNQMSNYALLSISLYDEVKKPPKFVLSEYFTSVPASSTVGMTVITVHAYDLTGDNVEYSIIEGNEDGCFIIDKESGKVRVAAPLITCSQEEITLIAQAVNQQSDELSDRSIIRISIIADDFGRVSFPESSFSLTLYESMPPNTIVYTLSTSSLTSIRYSFRDPCPLLALHPISGVISTKVLTKSAPQTCIAVGRNSLGAEDSILLKINVISKNKHAPFFSNTVYQGYIQENMPPNSSVLLSNGHQLHVSAVDHDSGINGLVNYRIISPIEPYFAVDYISGAILTKTEIDFEKVKQWSFYVQASDSAPSMLTSPVPALVQVTIQDINDVAPTFAQNHYNTTLLLPTLRNATVCHITAQDMDSVGILRYALVASEDSKLFGVEEFTGRIYTDTDTDDYVKDTYTVNVIVSDGLVSDSTVLLIHVENTSQVGNTIKFLSASYEAVVQENLTSSVPIRLLTVKAKSSSNDELLYSFLNPSKYFTIGTTSGVISWTGAVIDREEVSVIQFLVQARRLKGGNEKAQSIITIKVEDKNDCAPHFIGVPYEASILRDVKPGEKVINVKAIDADEKFNGIVRYKLKTNSEYFDVNKYDGRIFVKKVLKDLNFENISLQVIATDQGKPSLSSLEFVMIVIVDREVPIFVNRYQEVHILENAAPGSLVCNVRAVSNAPSGRIGYVIKSGNDQSHFRINFETGVLSVHKPLDREKIAYHNLTIVALDVTKPVARTETFVIIKVDDSSDSAPRFSQFIYELSVSESLPIGSQLLKVQATDPDLNDSYIAYGITGVNASMLAIDSQTGIISLMKPMDYETKRLFKFKLTASDAMQLTSESDLVIHVLDANDVPPKFISGTFRSIIESEAVANHFVTKLDAVDKDTISNVENGNRFRFSIISGDETLLRINHSNGMITLLRDIAEDDVKIGTKHFNISVSDGIFTDFCLFSLQIVQSRNTLKPPRFQQGKFTTNVRENGAIGMTLITVEAKYGMPPLRYSLNGCTSNCSSGISIDENTGRIFTSRQFDYEKKRFHHVIVVVTDNDNRRAFAALTVNVIDENDNAPKFVSSSIETSVSANAQPGESVIMVFATDDDVGDELEYSIVMGSDPRWKYFMIHSKQGLISVLEPLNDLVGERISLFVRVTDRANPPHHNEAKILLDIISKDNLPKFSAHHYLFSVPENIAVGKTVGRLQQDLQQEIPDAVFSLHKPDDLPDFPFSVQQNGQIIVNSVLNCEEMREARFLVSLHPANQLSLSALSLVTIRISDVNDNKPYFASDHDHISVSEDLLIGSTITIIGAVDEDVFGLNSRIHYVLEEACQYLLLLLNLTIFGNRNGTFKLDQETGRLSLEKTLDRESIQQYELVISCRDGSGLSSKMKLIVAVKDVNDSPPKFAQNIYSIQHHLEDLKLDQKILTLTVYDSDLYPFNITKLYIISGNEHGVFGLEGNDLIFCKFPKDSDSFESHLVILAHDGKHTSTAEIMVKLLSNTSQFQCQQKCIVKNITEDSARGTVIKSGQKNLLQSMRFYLTGTESDLFDVNKDGSVFLRGELSSRTSNQIELLLRGETEESLCIECIIINVESKNIPQIAFKHHVFRGFVQENSSASKEERLLVMRVEAVVGNQEGIGLVKFKFSDVSDKYLELFEIDEETGVITAIATLDREQQNQYNLTVIAFTAPESYDAKASVVIDVTDVNDNAPIFEHATYHLRIAEDEAPGRELIQLKAYDKDDKEVVSYHIQISDDLPQYLSIDAQNGSLRLTSAPDFEKLERFAITVVATDSGTPPLSSTCAIDVEVLDVNDNPPRFSQPLYQATVRENAEVGTKVLQLVANDPDSEHFGRVSYFIDNDATAFTIAEDGWISTLEMLDREVKSIHRLTVKAVDGGTPALSDSTVVMIEVEDENDNAPQFKPCNMTAVVQESVEPGHIILPVSIIDDDIEPNTNPYKFEIKGDGASLFAFDNRINLITTKRLPPHAKKEVYHLSVKVFDSGGLYTECPLILFVKEESRHSPQAKPLKITLNTLMGEFLGGVVGQIVATDQDSTDLLRYSLSEMPLTANSWWNRQHQAIPFSVDLESGKIIGEADLLAGTYRFNVSVTDGKYITIVPVTIDVMSIDQDTLDHSVSICIRSLAGEIFFSKHVKNFTNSLSKFLNVQPRNIQILSVQSIANQRRLYFRHSNSKTISDQDLEILFTISRPDSRGYHRPNFIKQRLENNIAELSYDTGIEIISVITEVCSRDICVHGECRDRLYLDDGQSVSYQTEYQSFTAPRYLRTYECTCRVGFGGKRCDVPIDKCSRDQCTKEEICVPMSTNIGFECICPPGTAGDRCATATCGKDKRECSQNAEIGVRGNSFFQLNVANSVERRLELTINFRTISTDAVIMHAAGNSDFHTIEIDKRFVQYRWNCGTGPGLIRINQLIVSDGKWHTLKVSRRSRHAKLVLDEKFEREGDSSSGSDVLNLYQMATKLTFGAMVSFPLLMGDPFLTASDLKPIVTKGMIGCFGRILVDGYEVPKTKQNLYLYNTQLNCNEIVSVVCAVNPCENEGTCISSDDGTFVCACPPRYSGINCEIDLTPCLSRPCPRGVECVNLHNDFFCNCPYGFTGKTCQLRGDWDPCLPNPCGLFGSCIRLPHSTSFICNCSHGYSGSACKDRLPDFIGDGKPLNTIKIIGFLIVLLLIIIIAALIVCIYLRVKKSRRPSKVREMEYETNNYNPRVSMSYDTASRPVTAAPPLFPRLHNSNYQKGLPTVQVRPLPIHERISSSSIGGGSRSPSLTGSGRRRVRRIAAPNSKSADSDRCDEIEPLAENEVLKRSVTKSSNDELPVSNLNYPLSASRYNAKMKRSRNTRISDKYSAKGDWRAQCDKRVNISPAERRSVHLKSIPDNTAYAVNVSSTNLRDNNTDDYITMRPVHRRLISHNSAGQSKPLLETSDSDGYSDFSYPDEVKPSQQHIPPPPPAHNVISKKVKEVASSRVYDEPSSGFSVINKRPAKYIKRALSAAELTRESQKLGEFVNIDDIDG
ncbi:unnamed protein product [Thelazia callipaeda]|uniref:Cadherin domain-containing protein n=1 Tax=Thelazia callipaeda TaxID=103827 RepID=A0A0N5D0A8_THECL|nr:unnamed protein product [Thelazia callipaeda]